MNRVFGRHWVLTGVLAFTAATAGLAGAALAQGGHGMHMMHGGVAGAGMDGHVDAMLADMVPDATPDQKLRLKAAMTSIHGDMGVVHTQFEQTHQRLHALLLRPVVDHEGLEQVRAEQIRAIDQVSRKLVNDLATAAEVLTPTQRSGIVTRLKAHKG